MVVVWGNDLNMQVLQEEMVWTLVVCGLELSSQAALPPAVWMSLLKLFLHKHPHYYCLISVGVVTQVVVGLGETNAVLTLHHAVGVGMGDLKVGNHSVGLGWA